MSEYQNKVAPTIKQRESCPQPIGELVNTDGFTLITCDGGLPPDTEISSGCYSVGVYWTEDGVNIQVFVRHGDIVEERFYENWDRGQND